MLVRVTLCSWIVTLGCGGHHSVESDADAESDATVVPDATDAADALLFEDGGDPCMRAWYDEPVLTSDAVNDIDVFLRPGQTGIALASRTEGVSRADLTSDGWTTTALDPNSSDAVEFEPSGDSVFARVRPDTAEQLVRFAGGEAEVIAPLEIRPGYGGSFLWVGNSLSSLAVGYRINASTTGWCILDEAWECELYNRERFPRDTGHDASPLMFASERVEAFIEPNVNVGWAGRWAQVALPGAAQYPQEFVHAVVGSTGVVLYTGRPEPDCKTYRIHVQSPVSEPIVDEFPLCPRWVEAAESIESHAFIATESDELFYVTKTSAGAWITQEVSAAPGRMRVGAAASGSGWVVLAYALDTGEVRIVTSPPPRCRL